jgi:phenylacetic acid degradation operon negative regulatory protein
LATRIPTSPMAPALARLCRTQELRASSLLVTVFGDALAPRRQSIWLGSLIGLLGLFGISPRLVRTSAFRLSADDWFDATRVGRRSYYGLSDAGLLRVRHADQRIYDFHRAHWDGQWTLVLLDPGMRASDRQRLQRELSWESFGRIAPQVFVHPHARTQALEEIIAAAGVARQVAVLRAESLPGADGQGLRALVHTVFDLDKIAQAWTQFITRFTPLLDEPTRLDPAQAFMVRTLLIHAYRRVALRDPNLPGAFLPDEWPGAQARRLCEQMYGALLKPSEHYLRAQVSTLDGPLRTMPAAMRQRGATAGQSG